MASDGVGHVQLTLTNGTTYDVTHDEWENIKDAALYREQDQLVMFTDMYGASGGFFSHVLASFQFVSNATKRAYKEAHPFDE